MTELDALFEAWLTRELDEAEAGRLLALLADPEARRRWRSLADLEGGLAELSAARRAEPVQASPHTTRRLRRPLRLSRRPRRSVPTALVLLAASLLLVLGGLWLLSTDPSADAPAPLVVTTLPVRDGQRLLAGTMVRGPAELRWDDGSLVSVQAEAICRVAPEAPGLDLERGDFSVATAPPAAAAGFRLRSPQTEIRVRGTRFSIQVDDAATSVAVSGGQVELRPLAGAPRLLGPGENGLIGDPQPPESGLVAWWPLDEGEGLLARDASGQGHDGSLVSASWRLIDGRAALHLPGGDARVDIAPMGTLARLQEGDYSIVAHYRADQVPPEQAEPRDGRSIIVGRSGWTLGLSLEPRGSFQMQHFLAGPREHSALANERAEAGRWYQLIGIVDRGQGRTQLLIDGRLAAERRWPAPGEPAHQYGPNDLWRLGISKPGDQIRWSARGALREVRLYDRALDAHDVLRLNASTR